MSIRFEERVASLAAASGIIWGVQVVMNRGLAFDAVALPRGPLEVCGIGILVWLHAKWRRSVEVR